MGTLVDDDMATKKKGVASRAKRFFIAAPMSGLDDTEYGSARDAIGELSDRLKARAFTRDVYFAGANISTSSNFTDNIAALHADIGALRKSDLFVMIYPRPIVTGALVEAGVALERKMPMVFLVGNEGDLPYFFRKGNETALSGMPRIRVARFESYATLANEGMDVIDSFVRTL